MSLGRRMAVPTTIIEVLKNCRVPFELNVKRGSKVLIVTDTSQDPVVWESLAAVANEWDCETTIAMQPPTAHQQAGPTSVTAEAMKKCDVFVLCPTKAMLHSKACRDAREAGAHWLAMEECDVDNLTTGGATLGVEGSREMFEAGKKILDVWRRGGTVRVTSDLGTDLTCAMGKGGHLGAHIWTEAKGSGVAFPGGEVGGLPEVGTGEGTVVWDTTIHYPLGLLKEPVRLTIKKGKVVKIEGGTEAQLLRDYIKEHAAGNECVYNSPAEISIGINKKAFPTGVVRTDKKLLGAVHVAMGNGPKVPCHMHLDGIIRRPTIILDDYVMVDKGKIQIPPFNTWA